MADEVFNCKIENNIAELAVNRPENLNALNADVLQSIILCFEKLIKESSVKAAVLTGAGDKAFVAGADIPMLQQLGKRAAADYIELGQRAMRVIEKAPFPVIAAVNGYALGGGLELALACDIITASQSAKFGAPEVNLGIIPGFGGTQRLIQRCGIGTARRLVLTGEIIDINEAKSIGLVDVVAPEGQLQEVALKMAQTIASKGPLAVREAKKLLRRSQESLLLSGLQMEVESFLKIFDTADREEGMLAFMQKRKAKFFGK
ncbi:MAG: enoyl-CoA hydratase-related protein [bacterium]|nr:enoyl-CoA hydratase-related protein [bacterium]